MSAPEDNSVATTVVVTGNTPSNRGSALGVNSAPASGSSVVIVGGTSSSIAGAGLSDISPIIRPRDLKQEEEAKEGDDSLMRQPSMGASPPAKGNFTGGRPSTRTSAARRTTTALTDDNNKDEEGGSSEEVECVGESRPSNATVVAARPTSTVAETTPTLTSSGTGKRPSIPSGGGGGGVLLPAATTVVSSSAATSSLQQQPPPKEKIQTKFAFFGLKKDREPELLAQNAEKDRIILDTTRQLGEMAERFSLLEGENQRLVGQCSRASEERSEEEERIQRYQSVLKEAMLEASRAHRRDSRRYISDNHFNLGQVVTVQTGMGAQDMWVHGNQYREIHDEIARLKERLSECEAAKKDAQSEKRSLASKSKKQLQQFHAQQQASTSTTTGGTTSVIAAPENSRCSGGGGGGGLPSGDDSSPGIALAPVNLDGPDGTTDGTSQGFLHPSEALRGGRGVSLKIISNDYLAAETQADIHSMEVSKIKTEIEEKEKLRREIDLKRLPFLKECTRVREEDSSAFAHVPILGPLPEEEDHYRGGGAGGALPFGGHNSNSNPSGIGGKSTTTERYVMMQLLGKGGFSEVWKAFDIVEGRHVALKIHAVDKNWQLDVKQSFFKHIRREFEIQKQINHEQVVKLYDVFNVNDGRQRKAGEETCVSVMEYCSGTDLDTELKKSGTIKEAKARLILRQILAGLVELHENGVIHYDLKPANILFTTDLSTCLNIKITDFGLSKQVSGQGNMGSNNNQIELTSQGTGTFWYLPPECFQKGKVNIGYEVDVWALGVVFFQMLYGKKPFADKNSQREIWNGGLITTQAKSGVEFPPDPPKKEDRISDGARRFIEQCLQEHPNNRPTAAALARDPYCSTATGGKRARNMTDPSPGEDGVTRTVAPNLRQFNRD